MRDQFAALLELKWSLCRRTFRGAKAVTTAIHILLLGLVAVGGVGMGFGLYVLCSTMLDANGGPGVLIAADVGVGLFLVAWFVGLVGELQRSDIVDFRKMLYLPVSLPMVFVLNYCASLVSPMLFLYVPAVLGASLGLTVRFGARMLLTIPLAALFYLMVAAWSYYAQGLIAAFMENKRRKRAVLATLSMVLVLAAQAPNFANMLFHNRQSAAARALVSHVDPPVLTAANLGIPLGWLPYGVHALAKGKVPGVVFGFLAMPALAAAGLGLGLRSTWRYYTGAGGKRRAPKARATGSVPASGPAARWTLLDKTLPWVSDDTCAVTWVSLLNYVRHPNLRMMLVMPVVFALVFGGSYALSPHRGQGLSAAGLLMGALIMPLMGLSALVFNAFGADEGGFRALILLPTERRKYLIGKNLATFVLVASVALPLLAVAAILGGASIASVTTAFVLLPAIYLLFCAVGNPLSVRFPYRIQWDGMRNRSVRGVAALASLLTLPLLAAIGVLAAGCLFIVPLVGTFLGYAIGEWLGLVAAALVLLLAVGLYQLTLLPTARLLQRREQIILDAVRRDRE